MWYLPEVCAHFLTTTSEQIIRTPGSLLLCNMPSNKYIIKFGGNLAVGSMRFAAPSLFPYQAQWNRKTVLRQHDANHSTDGTTT